MAGRLVLRGLWRRRGSSAAAFVVAFVLVLVVTAMFAARALIRASIPSRLREAE